jgi:type IV pilus assembly protein PilA
MTKNNVNKTDKTMKWGIAVFIGIVLIFGIFWFRAHMNAHIDYLNESYCRRTEQDANNIAAAIADYFSYPEHSTLPTIKGDSKYLGYVLNSREGQNIAWVTGDAKSAITIVVQDGSRQCPDDYQQRFSEWDSGKYTKKLE